MAKSGFVSNVVVGTSDSGFLSGLHKSLVEVGISPHFVGHNIGVSGSIDEVATWISK